MSSPDPQFWGNYHCESGVHTESNGGTLDSLLAKNLQAQGFDQDAEAIDDPLRAAAKPQWEDYEPVEIKGRWRINSDALGDPTSFIMFLTAYGPHADASGLRKAGCLALYWAVAGEQAPRWQGSLQIRESLMRLGGLIRVHSHSLDASIAGPSIEAGAPGRNAANR